LERLDALGLNLMILKDGATLFSSAMEGIAPLVEAVEELGVGRLEGSTVVDRIVGKAAALIIAYFKAARVYAKVLSRRSAPVLDRCGIVCVAEEVVEEILNREGTDMCPFERMVLSIDDPAEGYEVVRRAVRKGGPAKPHSPTGGSL